MPRTTAISLRNQRHEWQQRVGSASSRTSPRADLGQPWLVHRKSTSWRGLELTLPANSGRCSQADSWELSFVRAGFLAHHGVLDGFLSSHAPPCIDLLYKNSPV